ncbi:unnamed protein product [Didymodactylos carnosus]|uniref:Uncharacterized protein n=1 Tax=Didymodactylos carnosus TaxID=1234261 RepID=A0A8S2EG02_9BILA|nr:unnamed protein product [Didymodactylos carnosus]CAF4024189.1 unnamed protein product [Didymodactylos carnosus]
MDTHLYSITKEVATVINIDLISYNDELQTASVNVTRPDGDFDNVLLKCRPTDQICPKLFSNTSTQIYTETNCSTTTQYCSVSFDNIVAGNNYSCNATTIKENFDNQTSDGLRLKLRKYLEIFLY